MIRVLLAQELTLVREGLRRMIDRQPDMVVVGECATASEIPTAAWKQRPDVVVVDANDLPAGYVDALEEALEDSPAMRVILIGDRVASAPGTREIAACVWAALDRRADFDRVLAAIRDAGDETAFTVRIPSRNRWRQRIHPSLADGDADPFVRLTARERQMLVLLAQGHTLRSAAEVLRVSYKTGDTHKVSLMRKLKVHNRVELARLAIRERIVSA